MHGAPSVSYPVRRSRLLAALALLLASARLLAAAAGMVARRRRCPAGGGGAGGCGGGGSRSLALPRRVGCGRSRCAGTASCWHVGAPAASARSRSRGGRAAAWRSTCGDWLLLRWRAPAASAARGAGRAAGSRCSARGLDSALACAALRAVYAPPGAAATAGSRLRAPLSRAPADTDCTAGRAHGQPATRRPSRLLVIKYQRRIERLIGRMVRDVDLVAGHRPGNLHPRLPRAAAVPRRERSSTPGSTGSPSTPPRRRWST